MNNKYFLNVDKIKRVMDERGISEKQLAEMMGVPKRRLHGYIDGWTKRNVPFKIAFGLREALDITIEELTTDAVPQEDEKTPAR